MTVEQLTLAPAEGRVDVEAVSAWLGALDCAFRDPVGGDLWHLSASAAEAQRARALRVAHPDRFASGVLVGVRPDAVRLSLRADAHQAAVARRLVEWLLGRGRWSASVEGRPVALDLDALFTAPTTSLADPTVGAVVDGVRVEVRWPAAAPTRAVVVHSSGAVRTTPGGRSSLTGAQLARWNALVDALDLEADGLDTTGARTVGVTVTTPDSDEATFFDADRPPPGWAELVAFADALGGS